MCNAKNAGCKRGIYCKFANICPLLNQEVAKKNLKEMIRVREDETTNLRNMTSAGYFYYPGLKEFGRWLSIFVNNSCLTNQPP